MAQAKTSVTKLLCGAALKCASKQAWQLVTLDQIAKPAKISPKDAAALYKSRDAILPDLIRAVDQELVATFKGTKLSGSVRDNLFEVLMARFDILQKHRSAYISIARSLRQNPTLALTLAATLHISMVEILTLSNSASPKVEAFGLLALYTLTCTAWERDTSADLSKTMAALDRNLTRAEKLMLQFEKLAPRKR